jgi:phenylalanyl-tRNA synthetase beta chain
VFEVKACVENILQRLGIDVRSLVAADVGNDLFVSALSLCAKDSALLATYGVVSRAICKAFDIDTEVYYAELNWNELMRVARQVTVRYRELPKYPAVRRDLALLVDSGVTFAQIERIAFDTERKLLRNVTLFDVYEGKNIEAGKKSYAVSFLLQDDTQTMSDKAIDKIMARLIRALEEQLQAKLR